MAPGCNMPLTDTMVGRRLQKVGGWRQIISLKPIFIHKTTKPRRVAEPTAADERDASLSSKCLLHTADNQSLHASLSTMDEDFAFEHPKVCVKEGLLPTCVHVTSHVAPWIV